MAATQKSSKKRPASYQAGPTSKKAHVKPQNPPRRDQKGKSKDIAGPDKKRSRPVTLPIHEDDSSESDSGEGLDALEDGAIDDDMALEVVEAGGDEMDVDISNAPPKDPNGMFSSFLKI